MAELAWADIYTFVGNYLKLEDQANAVPDPNFCLLLGNQGVKELSDEIGGVYQSWDNAAEGDLDLTDATTPLPGGFQIEETVLWDGAELSLRTIEHLDENHSGWRTATGTPYHYAKVGNALILSAIPSGTVTGKLVIWGWGDMVDFPALDEQDPLNPLADLPYRFQLLPAYYILKEWPVSGENNIETIRAARFEAMWTTGLSKLVSAWGYRKRGIFKVE